MAEAAGRLWISQADSDRWAAFRVFDPLEPRSYCQALAKHQQVVEKSVKAVAAAMRDRLLVQVSIGYKHEAAKIASALRRSVAPKDPTDIQHYVNRLFAPHVLAEIVALDALAPRRPPPGTLHARNTEYPFERLAGDWTAPALSAAFDVRDVARFAALSNRIYGGARAIVSALRR